MSDLNNVAFQLIIVACFKNPACKSRTIAGDKHLCSADAHHQSARGIVIIRHLLGKDILMGAKYVEAEISHRKAHTRMKLILRNRKRIKLSEKLLRKKHFFNIPFIADIIFRVNEI